MRGSAKTRGSPHLAQGCRECSEELGCAWVRAGAGDRMKPGRVRDPPGQCPDTPGGPCPGCPAPRGAPALTMLPLCSAPLRTASPGAAAAPHAQPGRAAALYRGRHPGLGAGRPARSLCINSCASPVFLMGLHR